MTCKEFEQLYPEVAQSAYDDNGAADADECLFIEPLKNCTKNIKKNKKSSKDTHLISSSSSEIEE